MSQKGRKRSARERRQAQLAARQKAARRRRLFWIGGVVLLFGGLIGFGLYRQAMAPSVNAGPELATSNRLGPADAAVQIVEFGDFGCPSCRAWHLSGVKDQLLAEFGDQISFTFRHFPVITPQSPQAAEAAQCAADQGRFWEFHDFLYEQAGPGRLSRGELEGYAAATGLDVAALVQCLDEGRHREYVARDQRAALAAGARGTPSFYIDGEPAGFSYQEMAARIRQALGN